MGNDDPEKLPAEMGKLTCTTKDLLWSVTLIGAGLAAMRFQPLTHPGILASPFSVVLVLIPGPLLGAGAAAPIRRKAWGALAGMAVRSVWLAYLGLLYK